MTANRIDLHNYVEHLRRSVPYVHPAGRVTIDIWLSDMRDAADKGDISTVDRLAQMVRQKIDQELKWHRESLASAKPTAPER